MTKMILADSSSRHFVIYIVPLSNFGLHDLHIGPSRAGKSIWWPSGLGLLIVPAQNI
jgi:hypothetical protein